MRGRFSLGPDLVMQKKNVVKTIFFFSLLLLVISVFQCVNFLLKMDCTIVLLNVVNMSLCAARRGLDVAGIPVKKHSFGAGSAHGIESPLTRQPFSPISSNVSSKANVGNVGNELNTESEKLQKTKPVNNVPFTTPSKTATVVDEENRTPKAMPIPVPATPSTVSVPMSMATTPVPSSVLMNVGMTPAPLSAPFGGDLVQEIEYSFEERRLGFMLA